MQQERPNGQALPAAGQCPRTHPVKGNRARNHDDGSIERIYHVPGSVNYDTTEPEICFASVADAEAAGYRAPTGQ